MKILDCTLRDGGFLNNWNFDDEFAIKVFENAVKNHIDYLEVGYRMHKIQKKYGKFASCKDEEISKLFSQLSNNSTPKLTVMIDVKNSNITDFLFPNPISAVRVTCHHNEVQQAVALCEELKLKGFEVFLNLTSILKHTDFEGLKKWENKNILEAIYFADSFGELTPKQVVEYIDVFNSIGFENVGFHAHNSQCDKNLALKNIQKAIECGVYITDVSLSGIARGSGNLSFEQLQQKINHLTFLA